MGCDVTDFVKVELVIGRILWQKFCGGIWCGSISQNKFGLAFFYVLMKYGNV
jgi:hypothetical protein